MDIASLWNRGLEWIKKFRWAIVILLIGILLMLVPSKKDTHSTTSQSTVVEKSNDMTITSDQLEAILSKVKGAGKVEVMLTYASSERMIYQMNERISSSGENNSHDKDTVVLSDGNRGQLPLVSQTFTPEYLGAVVICQGADDPSVCLALSDAVSKATGLKTNQITVLKMK